MRGSLFIWKRRRFLRGEHMPNRGKEQTGSRRVPGFSGLKEADTISPAAISENADHQSVRHSPHAGI